MRWRFAIILLLASARVSADDLAAGRKVYTAKCARCHKFYDPKAYDDTKWNEWMAKMRLKARLNDDQFAKLSAYLQTVRTAPKPK